jgi:hypothetical protein
MAYGPMRWHRSRGMYSAIITQETYDRAFRRLQALKLGKQVEDLIEQHLRAVERLER